MMPNLTRFRPWIASAAVLLLVAAAVGAIVTRGGPTRTIYAQFTEAPGLYTGNHVDVLGIPIGTVTAVKSRPGYVVVTMQVSANVKLPADADAALMAPEVVADRFIQIGPAYSSGPTLQGGSVIPLARTAIPQSVDAVIGTLNNLAEQLGPNGANKNGALTDLVHQLAQSFGSTGPDFHTAIVNFSQALQGLSANSPAVAGTLSNLGALSQALADNSTTYRSFAANLDAVTQILANDKADISAVLSSLQQLFANLNSFIQSDGSALGSSIKNLNTFAAALNSEQAALAQAYDLSPLSLENLDNTVDPNAPGGPALRGRYDPVGSTQTLFNQVCGSTALRFLVILATGTQTNPLTTADSTDSLCAVGNALTALTPPPGASPGPDLSLQALTQ
jgi:phospholipid/cholesterol/gamma-HCH transport system substrate-binding protein